MKKSKITICALAFFVAVGAAYAFKPNALPGNLYFIDFDGYCKPVPCSTENQIGERCLWAVYRDSDCLFPYTKEAYLTEQP